MDIIHANPVLPRNMTLSQQDMDVWLEALCRLPTDPAQLLLWIDGPLRHFFAFERLICAHGELVAGQIKVTHWLASGFTAQQQVQLVSSFELAQRGSLAWWLANRRPFYIDPEAPPCYATAFEVEEIRFYGMGNIVAHGILNAKTNAGTYFSFSGVKPPLSEWHLDALRLITPVLNDLFLAYITTSSHVDSRLDTLSPRQKVIVRHLMAGFDNKTIARSMGISEKTVRNQLSEVYFQLGVHTRTQLLALLH